MVGSSSVFRVGSGSVRFGSRGSREKKSCFIPTASITPCGPSKCKFYAVDKSCASSRPGDLRQSDGVGQSLLDDARI